jgi:sarcosine oxidase subunit alpha
MMASAVSAYVNRWGVAPGQNVVIFGNNDDAHRTAHDLLNAGINVAAVVDTRSGVTIDADVPLFTEGRIVATVGRHGVEAITVEHSGGSINIDTDCVAMSGGWNPTVHLTCHMNGRPEWSEKIASFVPVDGTIPGLVTAGSCAGEMTTAGCVREGMGAAVALGAKAVELPAADDTPYRISAFWSVEGKGRKWLDFQNDVHVKDIRLAAQENFKSVEHMKRYTTQGMATDQGKSSNVAALAVLADATGRGIPETGTTTFRPPYVPVSIASMGAGSQGHGFAPERHMTSHKATLARNAPMIEAGLWFRPSYFPEMGETTWRESCDREVNIVRSSVGICDVSTLGKIDVQGSDAAEFLDFVYANNFASLKEGKVRYGLMLREDGYVMDDGTTARIGPNQYVMTTTTAAAGQVMVHLDFVRQGLRPNMDVLFISVTEQWAQFAVAGPKSRDLLNTLLDTPIDNDQLPYMSCAEVGIGGVNARLFRISFSGEHAYEIAVPARYGASLFRQLLAQAESMGGGAYGMEALNVLRIEKGFITHAEIHGRVTAFDMGLDGMVSLNKDCIGHAAAQRPGFKGDEREQFVGLKPVSSSDRITGGAHLFEDGKAAVRVNSQGYVTSVGFSPSQGCDLAQGFLRNGRARHGEIVKMVDHVRDVTTRCEVCDPVFIDPTGGRLRG